MRYSWGERENRRNVALHGIGFEDAKRIFEGLIVETVDEVSSTAKSGCTPSAL
jgi:uncharacterized DUF497 family protein